jgi:hypothetical protein
MSDNLFLRITRFIADGDGDFETLALELFRRQYRENPAYRLYVDRLGVSPESVTRWKDIPAVPAEAFKVAELSCCPVENAASVYYSSGTTMQLSSRHWMDKDALALYEHSLTLGYEQAVRRPFGSRGIWAMMPTDTDAPHSSLSHMLAVLGAERWWWDDWSSLSEALLNLDHPIDLFGTGFAFVALFDAFPNRQWPLPEGSLVFNTGGFKGRTREIDSDEFYRMIRSRFAVPDRRCVAEYGMSEMAAQFYSAGETGEFKAPRWLRFRLIDSETGSDAADGSAGVLRHFDLSNWNSVIAIQTQDLARRSGNGFHLLGRAPQAEIRGCSLTVEELWNREK